MRDLCRGIVAAGILVASVSVGGAADMAVKGPIYAPVPAYNWTAFYLGGFAGGVWGDSDFVTTAPPVGVNQTADGFVAGFYAGYDYQLPNNFVIGARIGVPVVNEVKGNVVYSAGGPPITVNTSGRFAVVVDGILGYSFGAFMPYIGAGVAFANAQADASVVGLNASDRALHTGLDLLVGAKYMFANRWAMGVQYNYTTLGKETYSFPLLAGTGTGDFSSSALLGTLEYRF